jgi:outer membrane usher protein
VQLDNTSAQIAPRAGAVVLIKFKSESGRFVLIQTRLPDGKTLPFGAEVDDAQGTPVGVVGPAGQIMARLPNEAGELQVNWQTDDGASQSCTLPYNLAKSNGMATGFRRIETTCVAPNLQGKITEARR